MDSVTVFFADATFEDVEGEAAARHGFLQGVVGEGAGAFFLWRMAPESLQVEYEPEEIEALRSAMGREMACAFNVASRHGEPARRALQVVSALMSRFQPAVLDDDFGQLWRPEQVAQCAASQPQEGVYALREFQRGGR